jgi:hypothetical protein
MKLFPGVPGKSHDRMVTLTFEGDVDGLDAATIAFDKAQLAITANIVVPGSIAQTQQLLNAELTIASWNPIRPRTLTPRPSSANARPTSPSG